MNIQLRIPGRIRRKILGLFHRTYRREDIVRLGSGYGGWSIPSSLIDESTVCYCAGVGEDVTFDLELIRRFNCAVHAFDPTPAARRHVDTIEDLSEKFVYHQYGLWSSDDTLRFYAPKANHPGISHSAVNLHHTDTFFEAPVKSLRSIMTELRHCSIDLLKMDIEGAEHKVLQHMRAENIWPRVLCVEFDQPCSIFKIVAQIRMLEKAGYFIVSTENWNYTFVKTNR